jgi:hypothetical protein
MVVLQPELKTLSFIKLNYKFIDQAEKRQFEIFAVHHEVQTALEPTHWVKETEPEAKLSAMSGEGVTDKTESRLLRILKSPDSNPDRDVSWSSPVSSRNCLESTSKLLIPPVTV